jgi:conjugative relaxase-like TrwC/TraI family protein
MSVLWALSDAEKRPAIELAQRVAVATATKHLEQTAAFARRGKGGAIREPTAGLTLARFDHHTSRDLDPQLHTHVFVFNIAPRKDGSWGAIVSRELYKAQKQAGAIYRDALAAELERHGYGIERSANSFRVAAIPRDVERAFSKRREAIEAAAQTHGYHTPKGMEQAALRTRQAKRAMPRQQLFDAWKAEARAMGFELKPAQRLPSQARAIAPNQRPHTEISAATGKLAAAARTINQSAEMPGVKIDLQQRDLDVERGQRR